MKDIYILWGNEVDEEQMVILGIFSSYQAAAEEMKKEQKKIEEEWYEGESEEGERVELVWMTTQEDEDTTTIMSEEVGNIFEISRHGVKGS